MSFTIGYTTIAPSIWDTNKAGGNINSSIYPGTNTPQVDLPTLPANYKLTELWAYLNVSGSHETTIDLGIIDINTGTNSTKPLLYSGSIDLSAGELGTGWQWVGTSTLNVDFSDHVGKRLAPAMGRPRDGQLVQFRYQTVTPTGGWYIASRGSNYDIPSPWPSGGSAEYVSLYAIFERIYTSPPVELTEISTNTPILLTQTVTGTKFTIIPF